MKLFLTFSSVIQNRDSYTKIIEEEDDNETLSKENIENFCYALNQQRIGLEALTDIIK